jgi:hypothetical protein
MGFYEGMDGEGFCVAYNSTGLYMSHMEQVLGNGAESALMSKFH